MTRLIIVFLFLILAISGYSQTWTPEQLAEANTAKDISFLTPEERDAIMYINLARLYPQEFVRFELVKYYGPSLYGFYLKESRYRFSLIDELKRRNPVPVLYFDESLYLLAKCLAEEQGKSGAIGHKRKHCEANYSAECCSYGMNTGQDIALQWLIDHDVPSLGHRKICLDAGYSKIGISFHSHKKYSWCAVGDFK